MLVVEEEGPAQAFKPRLVCKTFSNTITTEVVVRQSLPSLFAKPYSRFLIWLKNNLGGQILYCRFPILKDGLVMRVKELVNELQALEGLGDPRAIHIRRVRHAYQWHERSSHCTGYHCTSRYRALCRRSYLLAMFMPWLGY